MAWRETRASWARLLFFFLCVALGVAAIVVLRSVVQNVRTTLTREARSLVGADLVVQSNAAVDGRHARAGSTRCSRRRASTARTELVETQTMAAAEGGQGPGGSGSSSCAASSRVSVLRRDRAGRAGSPTACARCQPRRARPAGVPVRARPRGRRRRAAGRPAFTIRGVVVRDRVQRAAAIAFGPRVYIDLADLRRRRCSASAAAPATRCSCASTRRTSTPLTRQLRARFSARRRHRPVVADARGSARPQSHDGGELSQPGRLRHRGARRHRRLERDARHRAAEDAERRDPQVPRRVVPAGARRPTCCRCCGSRRRQPAGCGAGGDRRGGDSGLASSSRWASRARRSRRRPRCRASSWVCSSRCSSRSCRCSRSGGSSRSCCLRADTRSRRGNATGGAGWPEPPRRFCSARRRDLAGGIAPSAGSSCRSGFLGVAVAAHRREPPARSSHRAARAVAAFRAASCGRSASARPGNQTRVILMAVGLGCFFILGVRALQANLLAEFAEQLGGDSPDLVLIDVQPDQVDDVRRIVTPHATEPPRFLPLMRARVVGVEGRRTSPRGCRRRQAPRPAHARVRAHVPRRPPDQRTGSGRALLVEPALDGRATRRAGHRGVDCRGGPA